MAEDAKQPTATVGRSAFLKGTLAATAAVTVPSVFSQRVEAHSRADAVDHAPSGQAVIWSSSTFPAARIAAFNRVYPNVKIVQRPIPGAGSDASNATTVATALITGVGAPDGYYFMEDALFPQYAEALHDVGPYIAPYQSQLVPYKLAVATQNGRVVAIPYDVCPSVLTYRADIVQAAGIDVASIKTYDDLIAAAHTVKAKVPSCTTPLFFMRGGRFPVFHLEGLAWQQGTGMADRNGKLQLDSPAYTNAFKYFEKVGKSGLATMAAPLDTTLWQRWNKGQTAFIHFADWWTGFLGAGLKPISGKLAVAQQPVLKAGDSPYSIMGGSAYLVPQKAKRPDLGALFGAFMLLDRRSYVAGALSNFDTILPSAQSLYPLTRVVRPLLQPANAKTEHDLLVKAAQNAPSTYRYPPWYSRTYQYIGPRVEAVLQGKMSAADAQEAVFKDVQSKVVARYR